MAPPPGTLRVSRYFLALVVILGLLYAIVFFPGARHKPKLGIDLVGGIRVIFTARPPAGGQITDTAMTQARQIIEDRINGTGVTNSTVQVQGTDQLVVSIPGGTSTDVARLGQAAQLNFRPLIAPVQQVTCNPKAKPTVPAAAPSATAGASKSPPASVKSSSPAVSKPTGSNSAGTNDLRHRPLHAPAVPTSPPAPTSSTAAPPASSAKPSQSASAPAKAPACQKNIVALIKQADKTLTIPTTELAYSKLKPTQQQLLKAALQNYDCPSALDEPDNPKSYYIACDKTGTQAYLLGTVIVPGRQIDQATAQAPSTGGGQGGSQQWTVQLKLKTGGDDAWSAWTTKHNTRSSNAADPSQCAVGGAFPCNDFVGFTLDGAVISAPATNEPIVGQATQISGSFTQTSANRLADELKFGALPLSFRTDSNEHVSASLGTTQLKAALLAGGIGLVLVVIYSLLYYRALGFVTIASLLVSGGLTYAMLIILGTQIGFTLDLSGIAGFIVALGITADSFVVFFERIKDEVHDGRSVRVAIPRAWVRARRTILSADTVSFLAAAILYYFASADVKGFAFTLGMSTILDLVVVFLFTHPIVSLLSRSRAFGSARFTGLNSVRIGGIAPEREAPRGKRTAGRPSTARPGGRAKTATVVLDKDIDADGADAASERADIETGTVEPDNPEATEADDVTSDGDMADDLTSDDPERTRKRSAPEPGSAAERAAARRARLRGKTDDGKSR
ncbi:MAG: protein translocase subunit SecD [Jatrophihabitans sp.]